MLKKILFSILILPQATQATCPVKAANLPPEVIAQIIGIRANQHHPNQNGRNTAKAFSSQRQKPKPPKQRRSNRKKKEYKISTRELKALLQDASKI